MEQQLVRYLSTDQSQCLRLARPQQTLLRKIHQTGGSLFADVHLEVRPIEEPVWRCTVVAEEEAYLRTIAIGIEKAWEEVLQKYQERGVDFAGLEFRIENRRYHPVDSNSPSYEYTLKEYLYRLLSGGIFWPEVKQVSLTNPMFRIDTDMSKARPVVYETHAVQYLFCPVYHPQSVRIGEEGWAECWIGNEHWQGTRKAYQVRWRDYYTRKRENRVELVFGEEVEGFVAISITRQVEQFLRQMDEQGYNVGGFVCWISSSEPWSDRYVPVFHFNSFRWLLANLFARSEPLPMQ
ncbi:MAG: hypothetical protein AAGH79_18370 [Bacteroidota bacterium]